MQLHGTKKNRATSWDKNKSCNLLGQKIHATSRDKNKSINLLGQKNHASSWDKKIMQSLGPKKIMQPLGTKTNHTTSRDIENHAGYHFYFLGQIKNHATFRDKNIKQPLGTKKKNATCWGEKNHATSWDYKNHAPSWDKKNHATSLIFLSGHFEFVTDYLGLLLGGRHGTKVIYPPGKI